MSVVMMLMGTEKRTIVVRVGVSLSKNDMFAMIVETLCVRSLCFAGLRRAISLLVDGAVRCPRVAHWQHRTNRRVVLESWCQTCS